MILDALEGLFRFIAGAKKTITWPIIKSEFLDKETLLKTIGDPTWLMKVSPSSL